MADSLAPLDALFLRVLPPGGHRLRGDRPRIELILLVLNAVDLGGVLAELPGAEVSQFQDLPLPLRERPASGVRDIVVDVREVLAAPLEPRVVPSQLSPQRHFFFFNAPQLTPFSAQKLIRSEIRVQRCLEKWVRLCNAIENFC